MNRLLILIATGFALSCNSEPKNILNSSEPVDTITKQNTESAPQRMLLDTLFFDGSMDGELLSEKYASGSTELKFYKQYISANNINKAQIITDEHSKTIVTYLGRLLDLDTQHSYHVITNFKTIGIGEMSSPRGISNIAFITDDLNAAIIYRMNMPDELPQKIQNNVLYFTVESDTIGISISGGLPQQLCVPKIGCN